jgi:hypothetical protein
VCGIIIKKQVASLAPVAHTYNPRYLGGRDQEDRGSKPTQANSFEQSYLKNTGLVE